MRPIYHITQADPDRSRRRQAEFLVYGSFPWELVAEIGVMTESRADDVRAILGGATSRPVVVRRKWYY